MIPRSARSRLALPDMEVCLTPWQWSLIALASGVAALLAALAPTWAHWRRRRAAALDDPAGLLNPLAASGAAQAAVLGLSLVVVYAGVYGAVAGPAPLAFILAAFACGTIGHTQGVTAAGFAGLALVAAAIVCAAVAWLPARGDLVNLNLCLGWAAAGAHAGWMAKFWRQQLLDGVAWTTTGRLIPAATAIGMICALAAGVEGARLIFGGAGISLDLLPKVRGVLAALLLAAAISLSVRNTAAWRNGWRDARAGR